MPLAELNLMIHSFYCMEGRDVRRPKEKANLMGKFKRMMDVFGKR